jgi:hypothetical protein
MFGGFALDTPGHHIMITFVSKTDLRVYVLTGIQYFHQMEVEHVNLQHVLFRVLKLFQFVISSLGV